MPRTALLWLSVFAGPFIWLLSFGANFSLSGWVCRLQWKPGLYVVSAVALAVAAASAILGWSQWQQLGRELPGEAGGAVPRSRLLAIGGLLTSSMSFLLILAQAITESIHGACQ